MLQGGGKVMVSFAQEMNGNWYCPSGLLGAGFLSCMQATKWTGMQVPMGAAAQRIHCSIQEGARHSAIRHLWHRYGLGA